MKSLKVTFQKSQKLLAENLRERPLFRTFNSYSFNFKGGLCNCRTGYCPYRAPCPGGEQFLWFLKNYLLRFHLILFFFDERHCCYVGQTSGKLSGCGEQPLYKSYE